MSIKKIVLGGAAATALGIAALAGTGTAFATGTAPTATTNQTSNVQQGDQSTPDTGTSAEKAGIEAPETAGVEKAGVEAPETAGIEKAGVSDGPGGHADANGSNVDHQFGGNE
ncbi:MAG: hypothetical protein ACYDDW_14660 [Dermatophilaceae bacterium]